MPEPLPPHPEPALSGFSRSWARWEYFALLVPLAVFGFLATYNMHRPGLYYDEMFVISPAFGVRAYKTWFGLPILISSYVGADKSWIYPPIFAIFGISAWSIRFPAVLISCATLVLGYSLVRRILTPHWALAFTVACAVHPAFIFLTKVDWGPQVIMLFLKALCILLCFRWLDGISKIPWVMPGLWLLGFWDKFNFVWFIIALVIATGLIYFDILREKLRRINPVILLGLGIGLFVAGLLSLWVIYPLLQKPETSIFWGRLFHVWELYEYTCTGLATLLMWFKSVPQLPTWTGWGVLTFTIIFLLLTLVLYSTSLTARERVDRRKVKFCLWCLLMFAIIFFEIVLTPQAGGAHHTIMLFPFDLLACFSAAYLLANATTGRKRQLMLLAQSCALAAWMVSNFETLEVHFDKFKDKDAFHGRFSPRIDGLAKYLNRQGRNADAIYCVEWGLGNQLRALCERRVARKIRDAWPRFQAWSADSSGAAAEAAALFRPEEKALYVSFSKQEPVWLPAQKHFTEMSALAGEPTQPVTNLPSELAATYQVFQRPRR